MLDSAIISCLKLNILWVTIGIFCPQLVLDIMISVKLLLFFKIKRCLWADLKRLELIKLRQSTFSDKIDVFFIVYCWTASASLLGNLPFFLVTVITGQCYRCSSRHSYKDCDANRKKVYCRSTSTCIKMRFSATTGGEAYLKGCAPSPCRGTADCSKFNIKCEQSCCSSDYCNGASGPVVNAVILLIASFTSSFRHLFWESERDPRAKPSEDGRTDHIGIHYIVIY